MDSHAHTRWHIDIRFESTERKLEDCAFKPSRLLDLFCLMQVLFYIYTKQPGEVLDYITDRRL